MNSIINPDKNIIKIIGKQAMSSESRRQFTYCVALDDQRGRIYFNVLTRELILLDSSELIQIEKQQGSLWEALVASWFFVPEDFDDAGLVRNTKKVLSMISHNQKKPLKAFTIMPTTDCNARCFYCYEKNRVKMHMTDEMAHKVAAYIKNQVSGQEIELTWFGGEPLYHTRAIDLICQDLLEAQVSFKSIMVSNGYLMTEENLQKALKLWHLKSMQITIDGTESIYNQTKDYIYEGNAYQKVLEQMEKLLQAGIYISIRLNLDYHNIDDLSLVVAELGERFRDYKNYSIYPSLMFEEAGPVKKERSAAQRQVLLDAQKRLVNQIRELERYPLYEIKRHLRPNQCKADNGVGRILVPTGDIGLCQHFSESEFIGHIDSDVLDEEMLQSWRQEREELDRCAKCVLFPECHRLKKCLEATYCHEEQVELQMILLREAMKMEVAKGVKDI